MGCGACAAAGAPVAAADSRDGGAMVTTEWTVMKGGRVYYISSRHMGELVDLLATGLTALHLQWCQQDSVGEIVSFENEHHRGGTVRSRAQTQHTHCHSLTS